MPFVIRTFIVLICSLLFGHFLTGCREENQHEGACPVIRISDFNDKWIASDVLIDKMDSLQLHPREGVYIAEIRDFCMSDSIIYILDEMQAIHSFNTENGEWIKTIRDIGHAKSEYIEPKSIIVEGAYVYVLDFLGLKIIQYDLHLNYVSNIALNFPAVDFAKTEDGFLLFNMNANASEKLIVHVGMDGRIKDSFLSPDMEMDVMMTNKVFNKDEQGNIYVFLPMSDNVYIWEEQSLRPFCSFDFGVRKGKVRKASEMMDSNYIGALHSVITSKHITTFFLSKGMIYTHVYGRDTKSSMAGIPRIHKEYPFFPMISHQRCLVGIYNVQGKDGDMKTMVMRYVLKSDSSVDR